MVIIIIKIIIIKKKRKPKGGGEECGPLPAHSSSPGSRVGPAAFGPAPPLPHGGLPFLLFLLTGALLPQSSEMERRLKMGRRRPGSRLGDSEPLRLPELREPLR